MITRLKMVFRPRLRIGWIGAIALLSMLHSQNAPSRTAPALFSNLCASCHGPDGSGGQTPSLLDEEWRYGGEDDAISRVIAQGATESGMPAFAPALSAADIRGLVIFLREKATQAAMRANPPPRPLGVVRSRLHAFRQEVVASNLTTPWSIAFLDVDRMLVTELPGSLKIHSLSGASPIRVEGIPPVRAQGQGGLMAVAVLPGARPWVYLSFTDPGSNARGANLGRTRLVRGHLDRGRFVEQEAIYTADPSHYLPGNVHFGSRIVFDGKGHLFFSIGERGQGEDAQKLNRPNGKIHRLALDGSIPKDNPFVGKPGALASIYSFGNRNPQGLAWRLPQGELWETEHGPRGGDELNLIQAASNYGWPRVTFGMNYNGTPMTALTAMDGMVSPVLHWTPSIAVCAMAFYQGAAFPSWKGHLFVTALGQQEFRRLVIEGRGVVDQEILWKGSGRVREVVEGPDGFLYLALNKPDLVIRLVPAQ